MNIDFSNALAVSSSSLIKKCDYLQWRATLFFCLGEDITLTAQFKNEMSDSDKLFLYGIALAVLAEAAAIVVLGRWIL